VRCRPHYQDYMEVWILVQPHCSTCLPTAGLNSYKCTSHHVVSPLISETQLSVSREQNLMKKKMEPSLPRRQRQPRGVTTRFSQCKEMTWLVVIFITDCCNLQNEFISIPPVRLLKEGSDRTIMRSAEIQRSGMPT